ncbi:MAG: hypothetical protein V1747_04875 [Candidatus Omnitrophota bacterium]
MKAVLTTFFSFVSLLFSNNLFALNWVRLHESADNLTLSEIKAGDSDDFKTIEVKQENTKIMNAD